MSVQQHVHAAEALGIAPYASGLFACRQLAGRLVESFAEGSLYRFQTCPRGK